MFLPLRCRAAWALAAAFGLTAAATLFAQTTITASTSYSGNTTLGGTLSVSPASASAISLTSSTSEVSYTLTLGGDFNVNGPAGTDVTIGGSGFDALTLSLGATDRSVTVGLGNTLTIANDLSGTGNLTKAGVGTLTISGSASYIGDTAINGGVMAIADDSSLGSSGSISFDGGTLLLNGDWNTSRSITLNSGGGTIDNNGNSVSLGGTIGGSGAIALTGSGTTTLTQANTYSGGTTISAGTVIATNLPSDSPTSATGTGPITINSDATLQIGDGETWDAGAVSGDITNNGTVNFRRPDSYSYDGIISGTGTVQINGGGSTLITLGGQNTYSGETQVIDGTLADSVANAFSPNSVLRIDCPGYVNVNYNETVAGLSDYDTDMAGSITLAAGTTLTVSGSADGSFSGAITGDGSLVKNGTGTLTLTNTTNTYSGGTTFKGGILNIADDGSLGNPSGALTFDGGTLQAGSGISSARAITLGAGGGTIDTHTFEVTLSGVISGSGHLTHQGTGILTLSGTNTYMGGTTVQGGGVIDFTDDANLGDTTSGVTLNGGYLRTFAAIGDFTHDMLLGSNGGSIDLKGFNSTFSGQFTGPGSLTLQSTNSDSQPTAGILTLTNPNNQYAGHTYLNSGTIEIGVLNALPTDNTVETTSHGTLKLSFSQTLAGLTGSGAVTISSGSTLTMNVPSAVSSQFDGIFSGAGGFTKDGSGTFIVSKDSTSLSGAIAVNAGTLQFGTHSGTTGSILGNVTIASGATLILDHSDSTPINYPFSISGAGTFEKDGAADLQLSSPSNALSSFTGNVVVNAGTLTALADVSAPSASVSVASGAVLNVSSFSSTGATVGALSGAGSVTIASGKKLTVSPSDISTFQGVISGSGGFQMSGTGTETLSGANTYSGDTWVTNGILNDAASNAFSANSVIRVRNGAELAVNNIESIAGLDDYTTGSSGALFIASSGTLQVNNANAETFTGAISGSGIFIKNGAGQFTFANSSSFGGTVSIAQGTLTVGATNALTASSVAVSTGATFDVANSTGIGALSSTGTVTVATGQTLTLKSSGVLASVIGGAGSVTFANGASPTGFTVIATDETYTGLTTVSFGTLQIGASGSGSTTGSVAGNISLSPSTTLVFDRGSANVSYSGSVSGSGAVQKAGSGTLVLTGSNTYSGSTSVLAGTLQVGNGGSPTNVLPTNTTLSLASGTIFDVAASQTIKKFANSLNSVVEIEGGQIFKVALGGSTVGTSFDGVMQGAGGFEVGASTNNHDITLTGENTYTGGTTIDAGGILRIGNGGVTGGLQGDIVDNGSLIFHRADSVTYSGLVSGSGAVSLGLSPTGGGVGELTVTGANTYNGGTNIYTGDLQIINTTGSATGAGAVTIYSGGTLLGSGLATGSVTVQAGGTVGLATDLTSGVYHPANLTLGATTLLGSSRIVFLMADANGTAGVDNSLLTINGALTLSGTTGAPVEVSLYSANSSGFGLTANFNPAQTYTWMLATTTGGITGFTSGSFWVDTSGFQNSFPGSFDITQSGNTLLLEYSPTAVPEPSTWALLALGCGVVLVASRRTFRRR